MTDIEENREVGRPIEPCDLSADDFRVIIELYTEGASDVEVKAYIWQTRNTLSDKLRSFSNNLWERWLKDESIFREHINLGRSLSHAWWERNGRSSLMNKDFNYTGWYMNMKNRFGWKDKTEVVTDNTHKGELSIIDNRVAAKKQADEMFKAAKKRMSDNT